MKKGTRSFLQLADLSEESAAYLLDFSVRIKKNPELFENMLRRQTVGLIFEKASTRTRLSFEAGVHQMGGDTLFLGTDSQLSRGESVEDTARVVGGYLDLVIMRTFGHDRIERFAEYCPVPVINGLTDLHHPCQALSDFAYARELFSELRGLPVTYIGDGNNMAHSLMEAAALFGAKMTVSTPREYRPDTEILRMSDERARKNGGFVRWLEDPLLASEQAMLLYTDVWTSMGQEGENPSVNLSLRDIRSMRESSRSRIRKRSSFIAFLPIAGLKLRLQPSMDHSQGCSFRPSTDSICRKLSCCSVWERILNGKTWCKPSTESCSGLFRWA